MLQRCSGPEKPNDLESSFSNFFGEPPKDDPDKNVRAVAGLYKSPISGVAPITADKTRFYILGLAPDAARISIRFWYVGTVEEVGNHLRTYFDDIRIIHGEKQSDILSLFRLLVSVATLGKSDNILRI